MTLGAIALVSTALLILRKEDKKTKVSSLVLLGGAFVAILLSGIFATQFFGSSYDYMIPSISGSVITSLVLLTLSSASLVVSLVLKPKERK